MTIPTTAFCDDGPRYVTEGEMLNELTVRVECEWGYDGCHLDGLVAEMFWVDEGWMCTVCDAVARAEWEEYCQAQEYGWSYT